jgi:crotonobetainyl-CoA:carnitine CoA-transferase CaiB-like acyl-CoA transferase
MRKPLEGLKVLDLTHTVAGPYCTMVLADLGCDVIKIEKPGRGDSTRFMNVSDKFTGDMPRIGGDYFLAINRNKRSVCLELKSPEGKAAMLKLAEWADVVVQNFRPGVTTRLGLDYESLRKINPRIIYANISAYGTSGSMATKPGMDVAVQARSGVMRITGMEGSTDPLRQGVSMADFGGGIYMATAILTALYDRERTGEGQEVSVAMLDATMSLLINYSVAVLDGQAEVKPIGSGHPQLVPYQAFTSSDGYVVVGAGTNKTYREFVHAIGQPQLATDARFASNQLRVKNRAELIPEINRCMGAKTTREWLEILDAADVPAAPVNDLPTALEDLKQISPGMVQSMPYHGGELHQLGVPFRFSNCGGDIRRAPPLLGEHTDEVLRGMLNMDEAAVRAASTALGD